MTQPDKRRSPGGHSQASSESFADASSVLRPALDDLDHAHAAWLAGWQKGFADGRKANVLELAQALLHRQAAEMAGVAVETARQRHGDGWAQAIREQAEAS